MLATVNFDSISIAMAAQVIYRHGDMKGCKTEVTNPQHCKKLVSDFI
jgi:hypothetical protein